MAADETRPGHPADALAAIAADPRYHTIVAARMRYALTLTAVTLAIFFGYILMIAFDKALLGRPLFGGHITLGIPVGLGVILSGIVLTALYVRRANRVFDPAIEALRRDHGA